MKKILLLIVGMILFTFYACSGDNAEYNDTDDSMKRNNEPELIFTEVDGHGGGYGAGIEGAEYIPRSVGCSLPIAKCIAFPMFGGNGGVNVSVELIRQDKIRVVFLSEYPQIRPRELEALGVESSDFEALANHLNTHYSIPDFSPIEREVNQAFIRTYNLKKESHLYVFPGDYKIITDGRVKYVDIAIHAQNGELDAAAYPTPPLPWCNPGCSFEGWRPIPVPAPAGYVLVPNCSCQ